MNWKEVYFGHISKCEIKEHVVDIAWQKVRIDMKGKPLTYKYHTLLSWLHKQNFSRAAKVQCTNYVTALSRGGLIVVCDYR